MFLLYSGYRAAPYSGGPVVLVGQVVLVQVVLCAPVYNKGSTSVLHLGVFKEKSERT